MKLFSIKQHNQPSLELLREERRRAWLKDTADGLGYCRACNHEYTNAEMVVIADEASCPGCKKPESKTLYYSAD